MTPTAWVLLGVVVAWSLGGGLAFRLGHLRRMGRWYGDERLPGIVRFLPAPGVVIEERMVIVDDGREIRTAVMVPTPVMITGVHQRIHSR